MYKINKLTNLSIYFVCIKAQISATKCPRDTKFIMHILIHNMQSMLNINVKHHVQLACNTIICLSNRLLCKLCRLKLSPLAPNEHTLFSVYCANFISYTHCLNPINNTIQILPLAFGSIKLVASWSLVHLSFTA